MRPLPLECVLGGPQEALLEDLVGEEVVEVAADREDPEQVPVRVQVLDRHTHQHGGVSEAPLLQAVATALQAHYQLLLGGEHACGVFLVGLQLRQKEVGA